MSAAEAPPPPALPPVAVIGCHGRCGATTLTRLLAQGAREVTRDQLHASGAPVLLVAESTAYGTQWATTGVAVAHQLIEAGRLPAVPLPLLALVADSPLRDPPTVRARLRLLQDRLAAVVRIPYMAAWRDVDDPLTVPPNKALIKAMAELQTALQTAATAGTG